MEKLYTTERLWEAQLLCDLLEDAGVLVHVKNEHTSSLAGEIPFSQVFPEVWVADPNDPTAKAILTEHLERKSHSADGPGRRCSACGEESPSNFEVCWKCRKPF